MLVVIDVATVLKATKNMSGLVSIGGVEEHDVIKADRTSVLFVGPFDEHDNVLKSELFVEVHGCLVSAL